MKISDLQRQIALNRETIRSCEWDLLHYGDVKYKTNKRKKIKQYAKLQRALKSELAYRIQCNRVTREVEALTQKAKTEGWEVLVVDDNTYNQMWKGE